MIAKCLSIIIMVSTYLTNGSGSGAPVIDVYTPYITRFSKETLSDPEKTISEGYLNDAISRVTFQGSDLTFRKGLNFFSDLAPSEKSKYTGFIYVEYPTAFPTVLTMNNIDYFTGLPRNIDWRARGIITPVKNQQGCASSTMHSSIALVESWLKRVTDITYDLSEQQLIDCTIEDDNEGCDGGRNSINLDFIVNNQILQEEFYRYTATLGACRRVRGDTLPVPRYGTVSPGNWRAFIDELSRGPVTAAVFASEEFFDYESGIFDDSICSSSTPDHSLLAVGYDLDSSPPYIILKNSWGVNWGESGYIRMSFDYKDPMSGCGIVKDVDNVFIP